MWSKIFLDEDRLDLAKLFNGTGVEIGVAEGWYSSKIMYMKQVTKLYGVDPYSARPGYRDYTRDNTFTKLRRKAHERLDAYPNYEFIETYSVVAAERFEDNSLDFVYIDGDHSYEAVMTDIKAWLPKVKPGGIISGDDYMRGDRDKRFYDVIRAVDNFVVSNQVAELYLYQKGPTPTNWMFRK